MESIGGGEGVRAAPDCYPRYRYGLDPHGRPQQVSGQHLDPGEKEQDPDGEQNQGHGEAVSISTHHTKRHTVLASPWPFFSHTLKNRLITAWDRSAVGPLATIPPFCMA